MKYLIMLALVLPALAQGETSSSPCPPPKVETCKEVFDACKDACGKGKDKCVKKCKKAKDKCKDKK